MIWGRGGAFDTCCGWPSLRLWPTVARLCLRRRWVDREGGIQMGATLLRPFCAKIVSCGVYGAECNHYRRPESVTISGYRFT